MKKYKFITTSPEVFISYSVLKKYTYIPSSEIMGYMRLYDSDKIVYEPKIEELTLIEALTHPNSYVREQAKKLKLELT